MSSAALQIPEGTFLDSIEYRGNARDLENALGDARTQLSELINVDIIQRAKAAKPGIEINSEF